MKKILSSLLMLVAFTAFAQAPAAKSERRHKTPEERATAFATHLEKSLTLTADQKTKVHDLVLSRDEKMNQLREQNKGKDRCDWATSRKQAQDEFLAGMKKTLTADQYTKMGSAKTRTGEAA